jgi:hypothetical protein
MMVNCFAKVSSFKQSKADQKQARDWLPEAMQFPAIDPDKVADEQPEEAAATEPEEEELAKAA